MKSLVCLGVVLMSAASVVRVALAQTAPSAPTGLRILDTNIFQLPADRVVLRSPGIPGGIPSVPTSVSVRDYGAVGNGVADDYTAITNAIGHCANGGAVYFPSGTYLISKQITISEPKQVVLRGAGPASSAILIRTTSGTQGIRIQGSGSTRVGLASGFSRNSTVLTLTNNGSVFAAGDFAYISQTNDSSVLEGNLPSWTSEYQSQMFQITSVSGNTLTISRPLYNAYNAAKFPYVRKFDAIKNCGIEDLKIINETTSSSIESSVLFYYAVHCWMRNVESTNSMSTTAHSCTHVDLAMAFQNEFRQNYIHHGLPTSDNPYGISVSDRSCDNLIEDNILYYLRHAIVLQNGANGNVVGYNYTARMFDVYYPNTDFLMPSIECHGGYPNWNLIEGNIVTALMSDNYWGCSRYNTYVRNWSQRYSLGENATVRYGMYALRIDQANLYQQVVGNVLNSPGQSNGGATWATYLLGDSYYGTLDPTTPPEDPRVTNTMVLHGNYDFVDGSVLWDPNIAQHGIPKSYYLETKPVWFKSLEWPPLGPDVVSSRSITNGPVLPAQARFLGVSY